MGENIGRVETARKLAEKTLMAGRSKAHSIFKLTRPHWIKLWQIGSELPNPQRFSPAKVLCYEIYKKVDMYVCRLEKIFFQKWPTLVRE